jgi:hypothetical protein
MWIMAGESRGGGRTRGVSRHEAFTEKREEDALGLDVCYLSTAPAANPNRNDQQCIRLLSLPITNTCYHHKPHRCARSVITRIPINLTVLVAQSSLITTYLSLSIPSFHFIFSTTLSPCFRSRSKFLHSLYSPPVKLSFSHQLVEGLHTIANAFGPLTERCAENNQTLDVEHCIGILFTRRP